jgi:hypothetical protein
VPGDRRLADKQALGGAGEAAFPSHSVEGTQLKQIHE